MMQEHHANLFAFSESMHHLTLILLLGFLMLNATLLLALLPLSLFALSTSMQGPL